MSRSRWQTAAKYVAPLLFGLAVLGLWEWLIALLEVEPYILPAPSAIGSAMAEDRAQLAAAWAMTLQTLLVALAISVVGGVVMAALFTASRTLELTLFPYAVTLQVTPLLAIAPLLVIWLDRPWLVMIFCAWIVAFYPILSSTMIGLRSTDPGLEDLLKLYNATRWQRLCLLLTPTALPYFLSGLRVSVNLALVGAVVAEFVTASTAENPGLATYLYQAQYNLSVDRVFAALALISLTGVSFYFAMNLLTHVLLSRWRDG